MPNSLSLTKSTFRWPDSGVAKSSVKLSEKLSGRHQELSGPKLRLAISGASGLVGNSLGRFLAEGGHSVFPLARHPPEPGGHGILWDPESGVSNPGLLEGMDAVIHLAGENIASGRWTAARKKRILDSRVVGTGVLCQTLSRLASPPPLLISASAVGFYGNRGEEVLTETSQPGEGFLAEVTHDWEAATAPAEQAGIRVVRLRTGMVLSSEGGALKKLLLPFSLGLGGPIGHGRQVMSWVHLDDLLAMVLFILRTKSLHGPVNATAPTPVTNREFAATLGEALHRPAVLPLPAPAVRIIFGQMGQELLLFGQRVQPEALTQAGFQFHHPTLPEALADLLGK